MADTALLTDLFNKMEDRVVELENQINFIMKTIELQTWVQRAHHEKTPMSEIYKLSQKEQ